MTYGDIPKRKFALYAGVLVAVAGAALLLGSGSATQDVAEFNVVDGEPFDSICESGFGDGWTAYYWIAADPPELRCHGPDGAVGYMDVPPEHMDEIPMQTPGDSA